MDATYTRVITVHTIIAYIRVCTALHNYLLQSLIDMRSGNCENEWRSQPFVLLLYYIIRDVYAYAARVF